MTDNLYLDGFCYDLLGKNVVGLVLEDGTLVLRPDTAVCKVISRIYDKGDIHFPK